MTSPDRSHHSGSSHDDAATDQFVARLMENRHRIYAFITKQLGNPADVEDVFQRTSVILWRKMDRFDPDGSFFHWAAGVAFNEVRNFLRTKRRARLHFDADLLDLLAAEAREEADLSEARLHALRGCMQGLAPRQQELVRACYDGTSTITEVAAGFGRTRAAVYKQLARLRDKLLACIRARLVEEGA